MLDVVLIDKLTDIISNKYEAVRVVAKEARRINTLLIHSAEGEMEEKPTVMALSRVLENRIKYQFVDEETRQPEFEDENG